MQNKRGKSSAGGCISWESFEIHMTNWWIGAFETKRVASLFSARCFGGALHPANNKVDGVCNERGGGLKPLRSKTNIADTVQMQVLALLLLLPSMRNPFLTS